MRRLLQCIDDDFFYLLVADRRRASGTRLIGQSVQAIVDKTLAPLSDRCVMTAEYGCSLLIVMTFRAGQDNLSPQREGLRCLRPARPPLEGGSLVIRNRQFGLRPPRSRHASNSIDIPGYMQLRHAIAQCDLAHFYG